MKLSAKIEYASKAVLELALRYHGDQPVQMDTLSKAQNIPKKFLTQLLLRLKSSGIVNSSRGNAGGYFLAKAPSEITLAQVFKAVDTQILSTPKRDRHTDPSSPSGPIDEIWIDINKEVAEKLNVNFEILKMRASAAPLNYTI